MYKQWEEESRRIEQVDDARSPSPSHYVASMLGKCCWKMDAATIASATGGPLTIRTAGKISSRPCCVGSSSKLVWNHPDYMKAFVANILVESIRP